jgi:hypothetical protein
VLIEPLRLQLETAPQRSAVHLIEIQIVRQQQIADRIEPCAHPLAFESERPLVERGDAHGAAGRQLQHEAVRVVFTCGIAEADSVCVETRARVFAAQPQRLFE